MHNFYIQNLVKVWGICRTFSTSDCYHFIKLSFLKRNCKPDQYIFLGPPALPVSNDKTEIVNLMDINMDKVALTNPTPVVGGTGYEDAGKIYNNVITIIVSEGM